MPTQNGAYKVLSWQGFGPASGFDHVERLSLREWESVDSAGGPSEFNDPKNQAKKHQLLPFEVHLSPPSH